MHDTTVKVPTVHTPTTEAQPTIYGNNPYSQVPSLYNDVPPPPPKRNRLLLLVVALSLVSVMLGVGGYALGQTTSNGWYASGKSDGYKQGYNSGKADGYTSGHTDGYSSGYTNGKSEGYQAGVNSVPANTDLSDMKTRDSR